MKEKFKTIWELAFPYLKRGRAKDFVLHTEGVVEAMEVLVNSEKGDENILISAAILHDVGWAKVPEELQLTSDKEKQKKGRKLHLKYAMPIIREILNEVGFEASDIEKVCEIVFAHKFQDPEGLEKRFLIDADALSDVFEKQFYSDTKMYGKSLEENYEFRKKNKFYTRKAREVFEKELEKRRREIFEKY